MWVKHMPMLLLMCSCCIPPHPPQLPQPHPNPHSSRSNLVYMGMGEPLHNLPGVLPSIETLCQPLGLHVSYNKVCAAVAVQVAGVIARLGRCGLR